MKLKRLQIILWKKIEHNEKSTFFTGSGGTPKNSNTILERDTAKKLIKVHEHMPIIIILRIQF